MFCQHHRNRAATTRCIQRFNREKAAEIDAIILSGMDYCWKLWYDPRLRTSIFKACQHASGGLPSSSYFLHVLSNEVLDTKTVVDTTKNGTSVLWRDREGQG